MKEQHPKEHFILFLYCTIVSFAIVGGSAVSLIVSSSFAAQIQSIVVLIIFSAAGICSLYALFESILEAIISIFVSILEIAH